MLFVLIGSQHLHGIWSFIVACWHKSRHFRATRNLIFRTLVPKAFVSMYQKQSPQHRKNFSSGALHRMRRDAICPTLPASATASTYSHSPIISLIWLTVVIHPRKQIGLPSLNSFISSARCNHYVISIIFKTKINIHLSRCRTIFTRIFSCLKFLSGISKFNHFWHLEF